VGDLFDLAMARFLATIELSRGWSPPATADEADDSYRTLGVGRSSPGSHDTKQRFTRTTAKAARARHAWSNEEHCLRALLANHGFTIIEKRRQPS
jgi:hypothetical protein